jgi:hypothetical protein
MTVDVFWKIIDEGRACAQNCRDQATKTQEILETFEPKEIAAFQQHFSNLMCESCRYDLWAVAFIVNGGCGNDGFDYFRAWLIGRGEQTFRIVLSQPERIGDFVQSELDADCEPLLYAASKAYFATTGSFDIPFSPQSRLKPQGTIFVEDELPTLYPELWHRFCDS